MYSKASGVWAEPPDQLTWKSPPPLPTGLQTLNGRFENDDFTYTSTRGRSVVDYIISRHSNLKYFSEFHVDTVISLLDKYNII